MPRKIPVREIFPPDSGKNCKKSEKTTFLNFQCKLFKKGTNDFDFFFQNCIPNDTLSPQNNECPEKF